MCLPLSCVVCSPTYQGLAGSKEIYTVTEIDVDFDKHIHSVHLRSLSCVAKLISATWTNDCILLAEP